MLIKCIKVRILYIYIYIYICVCVCVCVCVCKVIWFFVNECECKEKISVNARKLCECKKVESGCDFLPIIPRIPPQFVHISYLLFVPKSLLLILFCWLPQTRKSSSFTSFSIPLSLLFFLSSSFASTRQPSLSHPHKISLSKEEIKGLTLKFQFQIVGGK